MSASGVETLDAFVPLQGLGPVVARRAALLARIPINSEIAKNATCVQIESYVARETEEFFYAYLTLALRKAPQAMAG